MQMLMMLSAAAQPPETIDRLVYYTVGATLIPVLFLAVIFQARVHEPGRNGFSVLWVFGDEEGILAARVVPLMIVYGILAYDFLAEAHALSALYHRRPNLLTAREISNAIYATAWLLVAQQILLPLGKIRGPVGLRVWVITSLVVLLAGIAGLLIIDRW
jgi:hypothetical protein